MSPANFDRCVRRGGKVKTIKPRPDVYVHVCYPTSGGSPVHGEVKHTSKEEKKKE
jgi:hypothetical protein